MKVNKIRTYSDKLLEDKEFREEFEREYANLVISEKISELRHKARLTQEQLAKRVKTTKSAISRYENSDYIGHSLTLLRKIASACGAELQVTFTPKKQK